MIEVIEPEIPSDFDELHIMRGDRSLSAIRSAIYTLAFGPVAFAAAGYIAWLKGFSIWLLVSLALISVGAMLLVRGGRRVADFFRDSGEVTGILERKSDSYDAPVARVATDPAGEGGWQTLNLRVRADQISVLYRFDVDREMFARLSRGDEITVNCSRVFRAIRWIRIESRICADCGARVPASDQACRFCKLKTSPDEGLQSHAVIEDDSQWRRPPASG